MTPRRTQDGAPSHPENAGAPGPSRSRHHVRATRSGGTQQEPSQPPPHWRVPRPEFHHSYAQLNGHATSQLDQHANIVQVNTVMPRMLGVTPERLTGRSFMHLLDEKDAERLQQVISESTFETAEVITEISLTAKSGETIPVDLTVVPQEDKETGESGYFMVIREQQETPSTVDDAAAFRSAIDQVKDAVIMTDTEGSLLFWNQGAERLFGWKRNEILGQDALVTLFSENEPHAAREITNRLRGGGHYHGEALMQTKNGRTFLAELDGAPILQHDRSAIGSYVVCRDITHELDKRESDWTKKRDTPSSHNLRRRYSQRSRVLHEGMQEAKNPLTTLHLQLHMINTKLEGSQREPIARHLDSMERNLARVSDMLQKLIDASKLERHSMQLSPGSDHLEELLVRLKSRLLPEARRGSVRIVLDVDPNTRVYGDLDRISQALHSLMSHSVEHTPPGGYLRLTSTSRSDELVIQIQDSGEGLEGEDVQRLLEPYPQIDSEETNDMSLYIAKGIIEAHGGNLRADSPGIGKGTTFTIRLPKADSVKALRGAY